MPEGSYLHFSVEEQVWLKKGQEVEEVLSISLDPEISIEEYEDYVAVKGCLYLTGEYLQRDQTDHEDISEGSPYRSIHEVHVREDGTASMGHRFPVDITIPASRIRSLEDIFVTVDTFDYTVVEENCLQLKADISISGIQGDPNRVEIEVDDVEEDESEFSQEEESVWENDIKYVEHEEESLEQTSHLRTPQVDMRAQSDSDEVDYSNPSAEIEENEEYLEPTYDFLTRMARQLEGSTEYNNQPIVEETRSAQTNEYDEEEIFEQKKQTPREENALYLTSMLTKEEEQFSKMKMCIIQPGDSLSEIAERYRVLPSHLARVNRLEEEEVKEGQILYIPVNR